MFKSFIPAMTGLTHLIQNENNFKFQFVAFVFVILLGLFFKINSFEWLFLFFISALVLVAEGFNTAIEKISDEIDHTINPKIKRIKDIAAAAVLISAIFSILIGVTIFFPYLTKLFAGT